MCVFKRPIVAGFHFYQVGKKSQGKRILQLLFMVEE